MLNLILLKFTYREHRIMTNSPKPKYLQEIEDGKRNLEAALSNGHAPLKPQINKLRQLQWRPFHRDHMARLPENQITEVSALITQLRELNILPTDRQVADKDITGIAGDMLRLNPNQMEILGISTQRGRGGV